MTSFAKLATAALLVGLAYANPGLEARQGATRFGSLEISPSTVPLGGQFTIVYSAIQSEFVPTNIDIFLQGIDGNTVVTPYFVIFRGTWAKQQQTLTQVTTLPKLGNDSTQGYVAEASYKIIAAISLETDEGIQQMGGVAEPITIGLD